MSVVPYTQDAYTWELLKMNLRPDEINGQYSETLSQNI